MIDERRQSPRALFCNEVEVVGYGPRRSADLSAGGMFLESIAAFPKDTVLQLRFKLKENEPSPIVVKARVLYIASGIGVGVEFLDLAPGDRVRIEGILPA
ncbi:MAG: PilZ domain-containing protein [Vicinamibacteria bacterium]